MTATAVETDTIEALDFQVPCQCVLWFVLLDTVARPECGKPAAYTATIHSFRDCTTYEKFLCGDCLQAFAGPCQRCKGPRLINLRPLQ